jgi:hypothetical protein
VSVWQIHDEGLATSCVSMMRTKTSGTNMERLWRSARSRVPRAIPTDLCKDPSDDQPFGQHRDPRGLQSLDELAIARDWPATGSTRSYALHIRHRQKMGSNARDPPWCWLTQRMFRTIMPPNLAELE